MSEIFITSNNFKEYMKDAINIYIASSFLSRTIIDDIKANLNQLPFQGGKNFRFLLNEDFCEDPDMRKVLINMLLELPNTEVRIYKGERMFHAKLYIFESGNNFYTAIGSFNATAGGAGFNIEAGVKISDREIYKDAKAFFEQYWNSEYTEVAQYDKTAVFIEKKFQPGDSVSLKDTGEKGVILNDKPKLENGEWTYLVFVNAERRWIGENNLTHVEIVHYQNENEFLEKEAEISVNEWMKNYILEKVFDLTDKLLSSFKTSRTKVLIYQFRPLFKILQSEDYRIFIADEVGLGKTIEAGIILKEFLARKEINSILVITPNSLKHKWKDELQLRFDEYFDIITAQDLINFFEDYSKSPQSTFLRGIIAYDQLTVKSIRDCVEKMSEIPIFDMIIIDEAHHLKNESTHRHILIKKLTRNTTSLVMLTATPIQLGTPDLFNLLNILLPGVYGNDLQEFSARLVVNEKINTAIRLLKNKSFEEFHEVINEINSRKAFKRELAPFYNSQQVIDRCVNCNGLTPSDEVEKTIRDLCGLNILNQYITRTLRKDVQKFFPERRIITYEYEYKEAEKKLYDIILDICRKKYSRHNPALAFIMPERRAASCLIAMSRSLRREDWNNQIEEFREAFETDEEEGGSSEDNLSGNEIKKDLESINNKFTNSLIDSKLEAIKKIIDGIFSVNSGYADKKIMIFSVFLATIDYLKEELKKRYPETNVESLTGVDDLDIREVKRDQFERIDKAAILICSEIAGEGLDFQFCHYLINYDMPWNPAKLEQRVGRIDRIGQESEVVTIFNLVNKYSIEDHIMARLFERIKIFNSAIGPLGNILSQYQKKFSVDILTSRRTEVEKEEYERQILKNIENKEIEQKDFEERQLELFGIMDYFYDEINKTELFQECEIKLIWDTFLDLYNKTNNLVITYNIKENIVTLLVDEKVRRMLEEVMDKLPFKKFNKKKKEHYRTLVNKLANNNGFLEFTFSHELALENRHYQFFNIVHPFIHGALYYLKDSYLRNKQLLNCTISSNLVPEGAYFIFIYRFNIINIRISERVFVEERFITYNFEKKEFSSTKGDILFNEVLLSGKKFPEVHKIHRMSSIEDDALDNEVGKMSSIILGEYKKMYEVALNRKRISIHNSYQGAIAALRNDLRYVHDQRIRNEFEQRIKEEEKKEKAKIEELQQKEFRITTRCTGIICVINEEVRHE